MRRGPVLKSLRAMVVAICVAIGFAFAPNAEALQVEDCVGLIARSHLGVPLHPAAGNPGVSGRLAHATVGRVIALDEATTWVNVTAPEGSGWITSRYVGEQLECPESLGGPDDEDTDDDDAPSLHYRIGTWNLEHFGEGKRRGFPENTRGGPTYPARTAADIEAIAAVIEELDLKIVVLQEVNGHDAESEPRSEELDALVSVLGTSSYGYVVGATGRAQRIAMVYDRRVVRLNASCETSFSDEKVNGKPLFARQPLLGHFTFLHDGVSRNDLTVVGLHLASGQRHTKNHDKAMKMVTAKLEDARAEEWCVPIDEHDIVLAGDFNASRFDNHRERLWDRLEAGNWDVLAESGYAPTRLAGHPLQPKSIIDYVVVSAGPDGLLGHEVVPSDNATVHTELVGPDPTAFRRHLSDHLPVTVEVLVTDDQDRLDGV